MIENCVCGNNEPIVDQLFKSTGCFQVICLSCDLEGPRSVTSRYAIVEWNYMIERKLREKARSLIPSSQAIIDHIVEALK